MRRIPHRGPIEYLVRLPGRTKYFPVILIIDTTQHDKVSHQGNPSGAALDFASFLHLATRLRNSSVRSALGTEYIFLDTRAMRRSPHRGPTAYLVVLPGRMNFFSAGL